MTAVLNGGPETVTTTSNMGSTPLDLLRGGPVQFRERMLGHVSSGESRCPSVTSYSNVCQVATVIALSKWIRVEDLSVSYV